MAENLKTRSYEEILRELFLGKDAALEKYAKVRHTLYEIQLWRNNGMPLSEIGKTEKSYFSRRFLNGQRIDKVSNRLIHDAITKLEYACGIDEDGNPADTGCSARCYRLVKELNATLIKIGLPKIKSVQGFIDWMTFDCHIPTDASGDPVTEPGYNVVIRVFHDKENRRDFVTEIKNLAREGRRMSMQDIYRIVNLKRHYAKTIPPKPAKAK